MKAKIHIVVLLASLMLCVNAVFAQRDSVAKAIVLAQSTNGQGNIDNGVVVGMDNATVEKKFGKPKSVNRTVIGGKTLDQYVYNNGFVYFDNGKVHSFQITNLGAELKQALELIDNSITNPQSQNDPFAWYVRGFIYKEWYKTFETQNKKSKTRNEALVFLKKAIALDTSRTKAFSVTSSFHYNGQVATITLDYDQKTIRQILKYLGASFYNDAGASLDAVNYPTAIEDYEKFKECMLIAEPTYNIKAREIEFKNALATVYEKIFRSDIKAQKQFFGMTETLYKQVLSLDTNNWGANYNLSMLYYNYGVDLINNMSVTEDIVVIENITDESTALFKKALPYSLKANLLKPDRREVLVCLMGIYFSLYEQEKSDEYKAKIALIDKGK